MNFETTELSGLRLVGPISKLGEWGAKHHGIILGKSIEDGKTYVAGFFEEGYQLSSMNSFVERYKAFGKIIVARNNGRYPNIQVAKNALNEIKKGGNGNYNIFSNNCESFANRSMYGTSISMQVINFCLFFVIIILMYVIIKKGGLKTVLGT